MSHPKGTQKLVLGNRQFPRAWHPSSPTIPAPLGILGHSLHTRTHWGWGWLDKEEEGTQQGSWSLPRSEDILGISLTLQMIPTGHLARSIQQEGVHINRQNDY